MEEMKEYLDKKMNDVIQPIEEFVSKYPHNENEKKLIVEFLAIHQLIEDENVKGHLMTELSKRCEGLFICKVNLINNDYKQHLIKEAVLKHYSYLTFKERFP